MRESSLIFVSYCGCHFGVVNECSRESLNEVHRRHRVEADNIIDELIASKSLIVRCSQEQQPLTESFKFYQDMRGYVTDLRECLNEKVGC